MKVLLVGSNRSMAIERHFVKYLAKLGVEISHFSAPDIFLDRYSKNILNKLLFKTKISTGYRGINKGLVDVAHQFKPDIIWIFKGMEIYAKTLSFLSKEFKLVNYNPDHPFVFSGPGSGNKNVSRSFSSYHAHITYIQYLKNEIESKYKIPTFVVPFGFELGEEMDGFPDEDGEIRSLCFIGNPDRIRVEFISKLIAEKINLSLFGHGWGAYFKDGEYCKVHNAVYDKDFWVCVRKYRIQLNIFREHNIGSHNMRTFEIPAGGGIQLAPDTEEHRVFFEANKEIFLYESFEECVQKARYLLDLDFDSATQIRNAARTRSLTSEYSYENRAKQIYQVFKQLI